MDESESSTIDNNECKQPIQEDTIEKAVDKGDSTKTVTEEQKHATSEANITAESNNQDKDVNKSSDDTTEEQKDANPEATTNYDPQNVHYEGDLAVYTEPSTGTQYEWSTEKNQWTIRTVVYGFEDDTHVYTDKDGVKYFWDKQKNAWFPKVDDDFMARYQMSYGFTEEPPQSATTPKIDEQSVIVTNKGEKRKPSEPSWFEIDERENTKVYVSNLPTDITEEEFVDLMQKCGLIMKDPTSGNFKIKLYKDPGTDYLKGDALCTYIRVESVQLALNLLDGYQFRDRKINVERAKFQMKGKYDPNLKPKTKKRKEKMKLKKQQEKLFDWRPEKSQLERAKHERIVIVKNLFEPTIFDNDVGLILEFQEDLREEASKLGQVRKVIIFDRHPEGIAQINMSSPEEADEVVNLLNGRWFNKRQLTAEIWDGRTKYKIAETDAQISERIDNWDKFLEDNDKKDGEIAKQNK